jgi:hypothetical protein
VNETASVEPILLPIARHSVVVPPISSNMCADLPPTARHFL